MSTKNQSDFTEMDSLGKLFGFESPIKLRPARRRRAGFQPRCAAPAASSLPASVDSGPAEPTARLLAFSPAALRSLPAAVNRPEVADGWPQPIQHIIV